MSQPSEAKSLQWSNIITPRRPDDGEEEEPGYEMRGRILSVVALCGPLSKSAAKRGALNRHLSLVRCGAANRLAAGWLLASPRD